MLARLFLFFAFLLPAPLLACSVCTSGASQRTSIREQFALSKAVIRGDLKNPQFNTNNGGGTTEFHIAKQVKSDPAVADAKLILLPKYYPVVGKTPTDFLLFFDIVDKKPDLITGFPCSDALLDYINGINKLPANDATKRLAFFFQHLGSANESIAEDAFLEIVKATDAELTAAKGVFDAKLLREYLANAKHSGEKVGVYALLLGLTGKPADVAVFQDQLKESFQNPSSSSVAGLLAGLTLLDSKTGWAALNETLTDTKLNYARRLAGLTALRYLQANRLDEMKTEIHAAYKTLLASDLADLAIGDLRRYQWWTFAEDVVKLYDKPKQSRLVHKLIVRYALSCPEPAATKFIEALRKTDPQIVQDSEKFLKDTEAKPGK